jgi:hypothetical protein
LIICFVCRALVSLRQILTITSSLFITTTTHTCHTTRWLPASTLLCTLRGKKISQFSFVYTRLTVIRLHERFPRGHDSMKTAKPAVEWYRTIENRVACAYEALRIVDMWIEQLDLIEALEKRERFGIIPTQLMTRPCRMAAIIMQVCALLPLQKGRDYPVPITEDEMEDGIFARPYQLVLVGDDDMDPAIWMDGIVLAHHTGAKLSAPAINLTYPGDEYMFLTNADVVFCSIGRLKKLVGSKAVQLSCVKRIIVDEPMYVDKPTWNDLAMILQHPEMDPKVGAVFVGRKASLDENTKKNVRDFATVALPY